MEMLLRNFLYSIEHYVAPRDQYIMEVILNNICNKLMCQNKSVLVYNIQLKQHTFGQQPYCVEGLRLLAQTLVC